MTESVTQNYHWTKPEVTKSASTWGGFLNTDLDSIDALVYANQQGIVPIGSITMFAGATAPANWLLCDGSVYSISPPYDKLFAVLQYVFGGTTGTNFAVPNLAQKFPLGGGLNPLGQLGGGLTSLIAIENLPAHAHPITDVAHSHGASQPAHNHGDQGHGHGASGADNGTHSHGPASLMKFVGSGGTLGVSASPFNVSQTITDPSAAPGVNVSIGTGYANLVAAQPAITVTPNGTGLSTTQNVGSGTPLPIVPPFIVLSFIIRFQ